mgnify:CR=1 FL=1
MNSSFRYLIVGRIIHMKNMIPIAYDLNIESEVFVITPVCEDLEYIVINRVSDEVTIQKSLDIQLRGESVIINGRWGMIRLISGDSMAAAMFSSIFSNQYINDIKYHQYLIELKFCRLAYW